MRLDEGDLVRWGRRVGERVSAPAFIGLQGELGAGKSVLARAIAEGAGVREPMPSPSFNLLFRYQAPSGLEVVHMDLYRLSEPEELWELGWEEIGSDHEIVLVEWPERAGGLLPAHRWTVALDAVPGAPHLRDVSAVRFGTPPPLAAFPLSLSGR